jgi:serine/threonine protein kinase
MTTNTFKPVVAILNLSGGELLMILLSLLVMAAMVGGVIVLVVWLSRRNAGPIAAPPVPPRPPVTPTKRVCPQCGKEMSADATQGLCPSCLLKVGLGTETSDPDEPKREPAPAPAPAEIAKHFPQLEILDLLGQGGMGMVYKARQPQLDRFIALKILSPHLSQDPAFAERFNREAKALARLNHPNIVGVFDFGKAGEFYYFLMEFVDGLNLSQMEQAKKRLAPEQALAIVPKICDALQYAHDEGVVHRDIKPGNILVDRKGRVKIADFGLAKLAGQEREDFSITQSRMTLGTPQYMAPEQFEDPQKVDHRADIYSLGVVFYEMLTGELPCRWTCGSMKWCSSRWRKNRAAATSTPAF